jgi:hypothetical protein
MRMNKEPDILLTKGQNPNSSNESKYLIQGARLQ